MTEDLLSTNRELLAHFRRGEKDALMAVWEAYLPLVHAMARRGFGPYHGWADLADIEDTVAATFAAAFETNCRQRYDGLTPFGAFLLGIGRNIMRRQIKKRGREPILAPEVSQRTCATEDSPEEHLLNAEQKELLERFPDTLKEQEQDVFQGYYRDGLSEEALAARLGMTRYRTRKLLHRANRLFKRYLRDHGIGGGQ